jgi:basic membrane protein A
MKLITPAIIDIIKGAQGGTWTAGNFYGAAGLAPYHDFDSKIPQEVKDKVTQIDAGLKDGSITTGYGG